MFVKKKRKWENLPIESTNIAGLQEENQQKTVFQQGGWNFADDPSDDRLETGNHQLPCQDLWENGGAEYQAMYTNLRRFFL